MHLIDMSNGRANIAFTGATPWHGLGESISPDAPLVEWQKAAGLEWSVEECQLRVVPQGSLQVDQTHTPNAYKALVRSDTRHTLNIVKNRYQVVQPATVLDFFHQLQDKAGVKMNVLGALKEGEVIWGLASTGRAVSVTSDDEVQEYILLATSYDYSLATIAQRTSVRVVCNNTLQLAMQSGSEARVYGRHGGKFDFKLALDRVTNIQKNDEPLKEFEAGAKRMAKRIVNREEIVKFLVDVFYPTTTAEKLKESKGMQERIQTMTQLFEQAPGQDTVSARGTAWGLVNVVTYLVDHKRGRSPDTRLASAFFSDGANLKKSAWDAAMKLAA